MNIAFLVGRLTRDPEIQQVDGRKRTRITLAVNRPYKSSAGIYEADFISCTVWNVVAEKLCEYCKKGDMISLKARIQNNNYVDKDDKKIFSYEIIADQVSFMQNNRSLDVLVPEEE